MASVHSFPERRACKEEECLVRTGFASPARLLQGTFDFSHSHSIIHLIAFCTCYLVVSLKNITMRFLTALQLWHLYLQERKRAVRGLAIDHPSIEDLNNTFERALISMHKMPRIWLEYLEFLVRQHLITRSRRTFDKALMALPVTQHERVWVLYLQFIGQPGIPVDTAMRVYRRYLKLEPSHAEEYIAYLKSNGKWAEAAVRLADILNDTAFTSLEGKSRHDLWLELCEIITKHPEEVGNFLKVEAIIKSGIQKYQSEVGRLWVALAEYYTRKGMFERARDVYEEGITSVMTVRDFSLVFDALTQFEEVLISARMESFDDEANGAIDNSQEDGDDDSGEDFIIRDAKNQDDLDLRLARLEYLIERRPELLSSVMLRQNPHNVHEWHKRAKIFSSDPHKQILCYTEAVKTVDPEKAVGKPHTLWIAFAKLYEKHGDLENMRFVFEKAATEAHLKYVDDLATVWAQWIEMELHHKNYKKALELVRRSTAVPPRQKSRGEENGLSVQERLYRSHRLWALRVDLEESLGDKSSVREAYDKAIELKIATVQMVLNYAAYLKEEKYFEDAFQVYEKGIAIFKYPHVKDVWLTYLSEFIERYGGKKVERARDLFRQACEESPPEEARPFFLQYALFEEKHGLARNAMAIYEQAVKKVPQNQKLAVYEVYLAKASEFFGVGKIREIYEAAIEADQSHALSDGDTRTMCLRYAALETRLGEIDRARAIYVHGCSLANPKTVSDYWTEWNDFEVKYGSEETFREMLRIKRSVAAAHSQQHFNTAIIDAATVTALPAKRKAEEGVVDTLPDGGGTRVPGFVSAGVIEQKGETNGAPAAAVKNINPEDIQLEEEDDDDEEEDVDLQTKQVPDAVFGSLATRTKRQKNE